MQSLAIYCLAHTNLIASVNLMAFVKQQKNPDKKAHPTSGHQADSGDIKYMTRDQKNSSNLAIMSISLTNG